MDLVNDLSSDVALALLVEGNLRTRLGGEDAKSLIALLETELSKLSAELPDERQMTMPPALSH